MAAKPQKYRAPLSEPAMAEAFRRALGAWFREHGRNLPWRHTRDPYAILVSELMLQQTVVQTVIPYYERFLAKFPVVSDLAQAPESAVFAHWSGLGYYRRARHLHAAAQAIVRDHGGGFPRERQTLEQLPGVARYTAAAVLSFAFDMPEPVVEANTARVIARLFALRGELSAPAMRRTLWEQAAGLMPPSSGCEHNSAMMDLGSLICRPGVPLCGHCPVAVYCAARQLGLETEIPPARVRPAMMPVHQTAVVVLHAGEALLREVPAGEWHAGLLQFPLLTGRQEGTAAARDWAATWGRVASAEPWAELKFTVTRHRVTQQVFMVRLASRARRDSLPGDAGRFRWHPLVQLPDLPLSSAQKKLAARISTSTDLIGVPEDDEKPAHH